MPDRGSGSAGGNLGASATYLHKVEYIAALLQELSKLARDEQLQTLAGILDVAHAEARQRCKDAA